MRVPATGPKIRDIELRIAHYRKVLERLDRVPTRWRKEECADVKSAAIRKVLEELTTRLNASRRS